MADRLPMTTHAKIEAERQAASEERVAAFAWREMLARPLAHAIRFTLDVELPRDVAWLESCRDMQAEEVLAELRGRTGELSASDWASIRAAKPHLHRLLNQWRVTATPTRVSPVPTERTSLVEAHRWMERFGHEVAVYAHR